MGALLRRVLILWGVIRGVVRASGREPPPPSAAGAGAQGRTLPDWAPDSPDPDADPTHLHTGARRRAELGLVVLLVVAGALFMAFAVLVVAYPQTQLLGGLGGGGLVVLAAALIVAGKSVVPQETAVEERPELVDPEQEEALIEDARSGLEGISRRGLIAAAAGVAGTGLVAATALPVTALGPGPAPLEESPWRRSKALVDDQGGPVTADDLVEGAFLTAFPEGADTRELASPVVVVRVDPALLRLSEDRRGWAPEGILAFSKICTHASCAVSLFRYPTYQPQSSGPALVCPCHYSTFDVLRAAKVVFGPAGRPLPQLPLRIGARRELVADGPLSGSVGPAWFGTHRGEL